MPEPSGFIETMITKAFEYAPKEINFVGTAIFVGFFCLTAYFFGKWVIKWCVGHSDTVMGKLSELIMSVKVISENVDKDIDQKIDQKSLLLDSDIQTIKDRLSQLETTRDKHISDIAYLQAEVRVQSQTPPSKRKT